MGESGTIRVWLLGGGPVTGTHVVVPATWKAYRPIIGGRVASGAYVPDPRKPKVWRWKADS